MRGVRRCKDSVPPGSSFFLIVGVALIVVCAALANNFLVKPLTTTPTAVAANTAEPNQPAQQTPQVDLKSPEPVFAPGYDAKDGLPAYICGADSFGSYFLLQQMQMSGKDVAHGFHLGIVPFSLDNNPAYDVSEEQRTGLLNSGKWDCLLTTLDSVALASPGVITAIVDESAGADQLWVRNIKTINDLKGKRISFSRGSVGEYFVYYTLSIARLNPRIDVTLVPQDSVAGAVKAFNDGQADAVSGWEPDIYDAKQSGGVALLSSAQMRIVIDVVVTSRQSIAKEADQVQKFHDAWFDTLKAQEEHFDDAAAQIAKWGPQRLVYDQGADRQPGPERGAAKSGPGRPGRQRLRDARHQSDCEPLEHCAACMGGVGRDGAK